MKVLTKRQEDVLGFVAGHISAHGCAPTLREINAHFGTGSTNSASDHLRALVKKGKITMRAKKARGICLVGPVTPPAESRALARCHLAMQRAVEGLMAAETWRDVDLVREDLAAEAGRVGS